MCGRYSFATVNMLRHALGTTRELWEYGELDPRIYEPRHNISPGQQVLAIRTLDGERKPVAMRWGLRDDGTWFNAKAEKATTMYADRLAHRRCVVPADLFFEWRTEGTAKHKYALNLASGDPLCFAGVFDETHSGIAAATFTTQANALAAWVHNKKHRMPVVLDRDGVDRWLDPSVTDAALLADLLVPLPDGAMQAWPVANINREDPRAIDPTGDAFTEPPDREFSDGLF